jgi:hypothetical protein
MRLFGLPEINPLEHYKTTMDLFYQFAKEQIGNLQASQYIQLKTVADPFDVSLKYKYYSYYNYLLRSDTILEPNPLNDQFVTSDRTFSVEFGRFLDTAVSLIEKKELDPATIQKINDKSILRDNIRKRIKELVREDSADWRDYCENRGIPFGDSTAYTQWTNSYGNGNEISQKQKDLRATEGDLALLRSKEYADPDSKEIKTTYDQYVSVASRIRYPTRPDTEYPNGSSFSWPYLAGLPSGDGPLFADRSVVFPQMSMDDIVSTGAGSFSVNVTSSTKATSSMSNDWSANGSISYGWFGVSASASSQTQIKEEFSKTTGFDISCQALYAIPLDASNWFKPEIFKNGIIVKNGKIFERFFGPQGSLLYYPRSLIVMRGFKIKFKSSQNWTHDYVHDFSSRGSGSIRVFGIGLGGGYSKHEHQEEHKIEQNGDELTFSDGDNTFRVVGYICQKNQPLHDLFDQDLLAKLAKFA